MALKNIFAPKTISLTKTTRSFGSKLKSISDSWLCSIAIE
jgi:hypothetical protein